MTVYCATCGQAVPASAVPPEPPVGTWVKDNRGAVSVRVVQDEWDGWAPAPQGFYPVAKWASMWEAHGPLIECPPWGLEEEAS